MKPASPKSVNRAFGGAYNAVRLSSAPLARRTVRSGRTTVRWWFTKLGDVSVREVLCEAAASLLLRVKKWSALRAWGLRIAKRSSMLCAIVAIARKLAGILHRRWIDGRDFKVGFGAKVTQRLKLKPA